MSTLRGFLSPFHCTYLPLGYLKYSNRRQIFKEVEVSLLRSAMGQPANAGLSCDKAKRIFKKKENYKR